MSYCTPFEKVKAARTVHRCTWCGQSIEIGQSYERWTNFDDSAFANKMHPECASACADECQDFGDDEYVPFDNERPQVAVAKGDTQ